MPRCACCTATYTSPDSPTVSTASGIHASTLASATCRTRIVVVSILTQTRRGPSPLARVHAIVPHRRHTYTHPRPTSGALMCAAPLPACPLVHSPALSLPHLDNPPAAVIASHA